MCKFTRRLRDEACKGDDRSSPGYSRFALAEIFTFGPGLASSSMSVPPSGRYRLVVLNSSLLYLRT
jgi:hypothetical protein